MKYPKCSLLSRGNGVPHRSIGLRVAPLLAAFTRRRTSGRSHVLSSSGVVIPSTLPPKLVRTGQPSKPRIPTWLKALWTAWGLVWAPLYWRHYGAQNFLFYCDIGNLLITAALWLESRLIFSWQAVELLVFQALYAVDLL